MTDLNAECEKAWAAYRVAHDQAMSNGQALQEALADRQSLSDRIDVLEGALRQIQSGADRGIAQFNERQNGRRSPIWRSVNVLQDNLAACYGTALAALIKTDDARASLRTTRTD